MVKTIEIKKKEQSAAKFVSGEESMCHLHILFHSNAVQRLDVGGCENLFELSKFTFFSFSLKHIFALEVFGNFQYIDMQSLHVGIWGHR